MPVGVCGCFQFRPRFRVVPVRAVPLAAFIPSRVPGRGRGAWGGFASGGQAGSITGPPAPPGCGGGAEWTGDLAPGRRACGRVMLPWPVRPRPARRAWPGSGSGGRASRRTPG